MLRKQENRNYQEDSNIFINNKYKESSTQSLLLKEYIRKGQHLQSRSKEDFLTELNMKSYSLLEKELYAVNTGIVNTYDKLVKKLNRIIEELYLTTPVNDVVEILNQTFKGFFNIYLHECELPMFEYKFKTSWFFLVSIYQNGELNHQFYSPIINYRGKKSYIFSDNNDNINYSIGSLGRFLATCFILKSVLDFSKEQDNNIEVLALLSLAKKSIEGEIDSDLLRANQKNKTSKTSKEQEVKLFNMFSIMEKRYPDINSITFESNGTHNAIPEMYFKSNLFDVFLESAFANNEKIHLMQDIERERHDYASSFMSKKYIPQHVIYAMQMSKLNNNFGYVEFDEAFDKNKREILENEVNNFFDNFFPYMDLSDFTIKLRRLGKHKVGAIYFVSVKCLCVDLNNLNKYVYAFAHLFNHYYDFISFKSEFQLVKKSYIRAINKQMRVNTGLEKFMKSKSKYNMNYYISTKEIFARSFELYVKRRLGLNNNLIPTFFEDLYCENDSEYMTQLEIYFDNLLKR